MTNRVDSIRTQKNLEIYAEACARLEFVPKNHNKRLVIPNMASRIEHTLLNIASSADDVRRVCSEAEEYGFRSVCCLPRDISLCADLLQKSEVKVVSTIDFPLGCGTRKDAPLQCKQRIELGADEVDMVIDVRSVLSGDLKRAREKIESVVYEASNHPVKVILETGYLNESQIVEACACAEAGGAAFVKTCTGFGPRGATEQDVELMRLVAGDRLSIKAAGGVGTAAQAQGMIDAGADIIGTSCGPLCI